MKKLRKILLDPSGYIFFVLDNFSLFILRFISTRYTYQLCKLKGIDLGNKLSFYGVPIFKRNYRSKITIGERCRFRSSAKSNLVGLNRKNIIATFKENAQITIGYDSGFSGTVIGCSNSITIGNNVLCGGNTFITDFDWHPIKRIKKDEPVLSSPVVIEDNVWLGLNVIVLKGSVIGKNSVIGANSVVTGRIPDNVIAAGNPCKVIKKLSENGNG